MTKHGIPHMTKPGSTFRRLLGSAVVAASMMLLASPGQAQTGPFANMAGAWSGTGKIMIKDGGSESIRCRATYTVAGAGLNQVLRCASDSYRFDLTTNVTASGNTVSGIWSETSRNVNGTIGGKINGGEIDALVEAQRLRRILLHAHEREQADHRHPFAEHRSARCRHHADALSFFTA